MEVVALDGVIRPYTWGSTSAIQSMLGLPVDGEPAAVAIVPEWDEGHLAEAPLAWAAHAHRPGERVVPVFEDGGVDVDLVADRRLDGIPAAVDDRLDRLDLDTGCFVPGKGHRVRFSWEGLS